MKSLTPSVDGVSIKSKMVEISSRFISIFAFLYAGYMGYAACATAWADVPPPVLSLRNAILLTEKNSPELSGSEHRLEADRESVTRSRSDYFPHLEADMTDSTGFPASSSLLDVGGLPGSPFRSGVAAALVLEQTVWDFGRTNSRVDFSKQNVSSQQLKVEVLRNDLDREIAREYFACTRYRDQLKNWTFIHEQALVVGLEVKKFVSTGQHSVVESYLVDAQVDEAATAIAEYGKQVESSLQRIGILIHQDWKSFSCPESVELESKNPLREIGDVSSAVALNPRVRQARAESAAAQEKAHEAESQRNPKIIAIGSAGMMQKTRLVDKQDYAVAISVSVPIFEGYAIDAEVSRARAHADARADDIEAEREKVQYTNAKYDDVIDTAEAKIQYLEREVENGEKGFALAKSRYHSLQGSLIDVREALRNVTQSRAKITDARAAYLEASYAKAIYNGWKP